MATQTGTTVTQGSAGQKKRITMPHTLVIILGLIVIATALTWIIPAGTFDRAKNAQGITVVNPTSFHYVESKSINPLLIPDYIVKGFKSTASLIFFTLICGAACEVVIASGALQSLVGKMSKKYASRGIIFIPLMTTLLALICTSQSIERFIGFAPIMVMITRAFGYDSIVGAAIMIFGGGIGFSTGTLNPSTTLLSQKIAELPLYSGIEYRFFSLFVFLIVSNVFLVRYANKIKAHPELSPMYELDLQYKAEENVDIDSFGELDTSKWLVLLGLVGTLIAIVIGGVKYKWGFDQNSAVFLVLAIISGIFARQTPNEIAKNFVNGAKRLVGIALIIGSARSVAGILTDGAILDTVAYALSQALSILPQAFRGIAMFISNIIINLFITSGSGQAALVMPIFTPLSDIVGITRQTAILSFNFGDGFCNYILPYSTTLMGIIGNSRVPYDCWMRFMWKMFAVWIVTGSALVFIAQMIHLGPM